jgi:hypothetical protein
MPHISPGGAEGAVAFVVDPALIGIAVFAVNRVVRRRVDRRMRTR